MSKSKTWNYLTNRSFYLRYKTPESDYTWSECGGEESLRMNTSALAYRGYYRNSRIGLLDGMSVSYVLEQCDGDDWD